MAKEVIMPKFGFTQEDSEIVEWLVQEGEQVEAGDPIVEVTTDKVDMEVEAPVDGILAGIRYHAGDVVPVTEIIAYIVAPGEEPPRSAAPAGQAKAEPAVAAAPQAAAVPPTLSSTMVSATPVAQRMAQAEEVNLAEVRGSGPNGRITREDVARYLAEQPAPAVNGKVRATPAARRVARENGLALAAIAGSGPHGRIQEADVLTAAVPASEPEAVASIDSQSAPAAEMTEVPFTKMRRAIASNLQRSAQEAPHIYFQADMDMGYLNQLVDEANEHRAAAAPKITLTAALTKAVGWALQRHPFLNSHLGDGVILQHQQIHIGIAVALTDGLIVPVVKQVPTKGISQLAAEIRDLAGRARENKLKPAELQDGTFTISNLGMYGIDRFTAIINPPQVGILAVGRTNKQFVPDENGQPLLRPICTLTLSVDHRVVDGAVAAAFMTDLRAVIERPTLMLM